MEELTKAQLKEVFIKAKELHIKDIEWSVKRGYILDGMCALIKLSLKHNGHEHDALDLPCFKELKPTNKNLYDHWWSIKNTNKTRLKKFDLLIEQNS